MAGDLADHLIRFLTKDPRLTAGVFFCPKEKGQSPDEKGQSPDEKGLALESVSIGGQSLLRVWYSWGMFYPPIVAYCITITVAVLAVCFRKRNVRWVGLVQGVALQMAVAVPIAILQLTGFVWRSWSIDPLEAIEVFSLSVLFDMAGWSVITPFEWLVPKRQTWVFSNLGEFGVLWISKVMLVALMLAWHREKSKSIWNWATFVVLGLLLLDAWITRDFPWWGT